MGVSHFEGVTNVAESSALGTYVAPDPGKTHLWFNDFEIYLATDWTVTETQAGATQAIVAGGDGGQLALVNSAADDDINAIAFVNKTFVLDPTKAFWMKCRAKLNDALQSEFLFGLVDTMTAFNPVDGVYLYKADGAVPLRLSIEKASATTNASADSPVTSVVNDVFVELAITYDPNTGLVKGWVNNITFGTIADLTNLPTVALSPAIGVRNGEGVAKTLTVDYIMIAKQRDAESA